MAKKKNAKATRKCSMCNERYQRTGFSKFNFNLTDDSARLCLGCQSAKEFSRPEMRRYAQVQLNDVLVLRDALGARMTGAPLSEPQRASLLKFDSGDEPDRALAELQEFFHENPGFSSVDYLPPIMVSAMTERATAWLAGFTRRTFSEVVSERQSAFALVHQKIFEAQNALSGLCTSLFFSETDDEITLQIVFEGGPEPLPVAVRAPLASALDDLAMLIVFAVAPRVHETMTVERVAVVSMAVSNAWPKFGKTQSSETLAQLVQRQRRCARDVPLTEELGCSRSKVALEVFVPNFWEKSSGPLRVGAVRPLLPEAVRLGSLSAFK